MSIHILATEHMTDLAKRVYDRLKDKDFTYAEVEYVNFACQEVKPRIPTTVRGEDTYLFHSLFHPNPNDAMMKLLLTNDALSRGSAESITLVLPYMSYLRQDRKDEPRVPISAKVMANLIQTNPKVERVITLDMHCDQIQGFYDIPVDNLYGSLILAEHFQKEYSKNLRNLVVVSPDVGGITRAKLFARYLDGRKTIGMIEKEHSENTVNEVETLSYQGPSLNGKDAAFYDDMVDTAGSIIKGSKLLRNLGAQKIYAVTPHGVLSPKYQSTAEEKLRKAEIRLVVSDSIPRSEQYRTENKDWQSTVSLDQLLAKAILQTSTVGGSVSSLFRR